MKEVALTQPTLVVLALLAVFGILSLLYVIDRHVRKEYRAWQKRRDELNTTARSFRSFVVGRLQVMIDTNQPIDAKRIYDIINLPEGREYARHGYRINIDTTPNENCFIVVVGNDTWRCKLLMPKEAPTHWKEFDLWCLNQCNEMARISR